MLGFSIAGIIGHQNRINGYVLIGCLYMKECRDFIKTVSLRMTSMLLIFTRTPLTNSKLSASDKRYFAAPVDNEGN